MRSQGQAIVEMTLMMAILFFAVLGLIDAARLFITQFQQDRATYTLVAWASQHPGESWNDLANKEFPGCAVDVREGEVKDTLRATVTCRFHPVGYAAWELLPITTTEIYSTTPPSRSGSPSPSPSASHSS